MSDAAAGMASTEQSQANNLRSLRLLTDHLIRQHNRAMAMRLPEGPRQSPEGVRHIDRDKSI